MKPVLAVFHLYLYISLITAWHGNFPIITLEWQVLDIYYLLSYNFLLLKYFCQGYLSKLHCLTDFLYSSRLKTLHSKKGPSLIFFFNCVIQDSTVGILFSLPFYAQLSTIFVFSMYQFLGNVCVADSTHHYFIWIHGLIIFPVLSQQIILLLESIEW